MNKLNIWNFSTTVFSGTDSFDRLSEFKNKNIFIVCDSFLVTTEIFKEILTLLVKNKNQVEIYSEVNPDPPIEDVVKCMKAMEEFSPDSVLAIGGGSTIDLTKGVIYFAKEMSAFSIEKFIAIPSTSGTGSEVTSITVITDKKNNIKYPLADDSMIPDEAILNPALVVSSPPKVTAHSGMDVLAHALEALVAKDATMYTDALAEKAIEIVFQELVHCYEDGNRIESRMKMHEASCMAGLAFDSAGLGVCHSLAHQVGGQMGIAHGLANTMLLPHVVKLNAQDPLAKKKYAEVSRRLTPASCNLSDDQAVENLSQQIKKLANQLNCPMSLSESGLEKWVAKGYQEEVVRNAKKDFTFKSNPIVPSDKQLAEVYAAII